MIDEASIQDEILARRGDRKLLFNVGALSSDFTQWASVWFSDVVDIESYYPQYRDRLAASWNVSNCLPVYSEQLLFTIQDFLKIVEGKSTWVLNCDDSYLMIYILKSAKSPMIVVPNADEDDIPPRVRRKVGSDCHVRVIDGNLFIWRV